MSDRQDDRADDPRPATEGDDAATPPSPAEPVRRTDGQLWEAGVGSWSTTPQPAARPASAQLTPPSACGPGPEDSRPNAPVSLTSQTLTLPPLQRTPVAQA